MLGMRIQFFTTTAKWFFLFFIIVFISGIYSAFHLASVVEKNNNSDLQHRINLELNQISLNVQEALLRYEYSLQGLRASIHAMGINNFNYQTHLTYFKSRDYTKEFPGARGFGVIKKVSQAELATFLTSARAERNGEFELKQLDNPQDPLFIIQYIEPEANNLQAVGLDIGSESNRRLAAINSAASGVPQLTGPITLVQANQHKLHGFLLLLPFFKDDLTQKVVAGWVYSPLLINEIIDVVANNNKKFTIDISDIYINEATLFYQNDASTQVNDRFTVRKIINLYGRQWEVAISPSDAFIASLNYRNPKQIKIQVLVFTTAILLFGFFFALLITRRVETIKHKLSYEAVVKNASEGIIGVDPLFTILHWNEAADQLFHFSDVNAKNKPLINWLSTFISSDKLITYYKQIARGEAVKSIPFTYTGENTDSDTFLLLNFMPLMRGIEFIGATISISDVTAIRRLHNTLEQHNQQLENKVAQQTQLLERKSNFQKSVLNSTQSAIIATNQYGDITLLNQSAIHLFGFSEEALLSNKSLLSLIKQDETPPLESFLSWIKLKLSQQNRSVAGSFYTQTGAIVPVNMTISHILNERSEPEGFLIIAEDLAEKRSLERHISLVNAALDTSQDILLWFDETGKILLSNPYACLALGYNNEQFNSLAVQNLLQFEPKETWKNIKERIIRNNRITCERNFITAAGELIPTLISASVLTVDKKTVIYFAAKNITERLQEEDELRFALDHADKASKIKTDFIANISHELRTPLHAINGMLQILELTKLTEQQANTLTSAKNSVIALNETINDIMDLTSIERGDLLLDNKDFNFEELLKEIGAQLNILCGEKALEVHFSLTKEVPLTLHGDAKKIKQIIINLAGNAIKFTHSGEVVIAFSTSQKSIDEIWLNIAISDTGIGINPNKLTKIFELFNQVDNSNTRQYGGLGIGLTIANQLVQLMEGSINVISQLHEGSTFSCTLRLQKAQSATPSVLHNPYQLNILIVDDNPTSLEILANTVALLGCDATLANSPEHGLALFKQAIERKTAFDLVLLDWKMPEMDGWQLAEQIRQYTDDDNLPLLIMVSAHGKQVLAYKNNETKQILNGFLSKPVTRVTLLDAISDAMSASQHKSPMMKTQPPHHQPLLNKRILVVEDNPTNQLIAKMLLDNQGANTIIANGGYQALNELENCLLPFDVILMDIQMPDMDGYETTRRIRANEKYVDLPILAITANVMDDDKRKCLAAGMNGHIGKPFQLEVVVQRIIAATLSQSEISPPSINQSIDYQIDPAVLRLCVQHKIDIKQSLSRFNFLVPLYVKTLRLFLDDLQQYQLVLNDLTHPLEHKAIKLIFHTLKSTAGTLGFTPLSTLAKKLEHQLQGNNQDDQRLIAEQLPLFNQTNTAAMTAISHLLTLLGSTPDKTTIVNRGNQEVIDMDEFELLFDEVSTFNMKAINRFQQISTSLRPVSTELCDELTTHLNKLNFKEAKKILMELRYLIEGRQT